jgi:hypothetical protein
LHADAVESAMRMIGDFVSLTQMNPAELGNSTRGILETVAAELVARVPMLGSGELVAGVVDQAVDFGIGQFERRYLQCCSNSRYSQPSLRSRHLDLGAFNSGCSVIIRRLTGT